MSMNPVGWFEIYVQDMARAKRFYETVLQVKLTHLEAPAEAPPMPGLEMWQFPWEDNAAGATGALAKMDGMDSGGSSVLVYFSCEDCADAAGRVEGAGGTLVQPKMSIGEYGFVAMVKDTEGNMIGLHSRK